MIGDFCWVELTTSDLPRARQFYADVFGWSMAEQNLRTHTGRFLPSAALLWEGSLGGAAYELLREQRECGLGPHWLPFVGVESVDRSTSAAEKLRASTVVDPIDVFHLGRMSILLDPTGAALGLWQPRRLPGFGASLAPGSPCWFELATGDVEGARAFYGTLFGWTHVPGNGSSRRATFGQRKGSPGLRALDTGESARWAAHFAVESCNASCERIVAAGGTLERPAEDLPDFARIAAARDPQGAGFSILEALAS